MSPEIVHEFKYIEVQPGETIQSYGYSPEHIIKTTDRSYTNEGYASQNLLGIWLLVPTELDE